MRCALALLLLIGCSGKSDAPAARSATATSGAQVYKMACVRCHGPTGAGDGSSSAKLGVVPRLDREMPADYIRTVVTEGRGAMPAHANRLEPAAIDAVVTYVQGMKR